MKKALKLVALGMTAAVAVSSLASASTIIYKLEDGNKRFFNARDLKTATPCDLKAHIAKEFGRDPSKFDIVYVRRALDGNKSFDAQGINGAYILRVQAVDKSRQC